MARESPVLIDLDADSGVVARLGGRARLLGAWSIEEALAKTDAPEVFVLTSRPSTVEDALRFRPARNVIPVGFFENAGRARELDRAGAWFLADTENELLRFVGEPRRPVSLSIVFLAFNEEGAIEAAIRDAERFCETYVEDFEIIVVDDGSLDGTRARVVLLKHPRVRLIPHEINQGMGASLRDGFLAAGKDYLAPLPADRQVRAHSLLPLLAEASPERSAASLYRGLPSGRHRGILSRVFRWLVKNVGRLDVDFAGSYLFHRKWLAVIDPRTIPYDSYLFSFEALARLRRGGCPLVHVDIRPLPRETGASTEIRLTRMFSVLRELFSVRMARRG